MNLNLKEFWRGHHRLTQTPNRVQDIKRQSSCKELESEPAIYLINDLLLGTKFYITLQYHPKLARVRHRESLPGNTHCGCLKQTCFGHLPCTALGVSCPGGRTDQNTGFRELTSRRVKTTEQSSHIPLGKAQADRLPGRAPSP